MSLSAHSPWSPSQRYSHHCSSGSHAVLKSQLDGHAQMLPVAAASSTTAMAGGGCVSKLSSTHDTAVAAAQRCPTQLQQSVARPGEGGV